MTARAHQWAARETAAQIAPRQEVIRHTLRVCHIASGDLWAGAEAQIAASISYLATVPHVTLFAVLLNEGRLSDELRRLGVRVTVIDERRHNPFRILAMLARVLKQDRIDIVHTHRYKESVLGTLAAKLARVPRVVRTVHGINEGLSGWPSAKMRMYETLDRIVLWWFADAIIAVSRHLATTLRASGYRATAVSHLHNGIHLGKVKASRPPEDVKRELGIKPGALIIGTVGRLSPIKGHSWFLRAAKRILTREPGAIFLLVGDGPLDAELSATAAQIGIGSRCHFLGARNDVYDLIAAMDIFVLPSLDEGVPMAVLEAMALERPVVATTVGGLPEIVQHATTGLLVAPRDDRALAEACLKLARDREWARTLGTAARQAVETQFSHEVNGRVLMDVYRARSVQVMTPQRFPQASAERPGALALAYALVRCLPIYITRKLRLGASRRANKRRMCRLRRNPASLMTTLRKATRILIVCHGNIIRSPFAARLLAHAVSEHGRVSICSAGLGAVAGSPPHPKAVITATALDIDLSQHTAASVTSDSVAASDVIFVMDIQQLVEMCQRFPEARMKTFLLTSLAPDTPLEVRDPVNGDASLFQACYDHIARAIGPITRALGDTPGHTCRIRQSEFVCL